MFSIVADALFLTVMISGLALFGLAGISGIVALMQGAMQLQEASITHVAKVITVIALVALGGEWAAYEVTTLFERVVGSFGEIQRELR